MDVLVQELKHRLKNLDIDPQPDPKTPPLQPEQKELLLYVVIFGAFYPNYFSRKAPMSRDEEPERQAERTLCGLDPYSTVKLSGFPANHPHKSYIHQLKERVNRDIFGNSNSILIQFDERTVHSQSS